MLEWIKELEGVTFDAGTYSQSYQDHLLHIIFTAIPKVNETPFAVEFGFSSDSLVEGTGSNVAALVLEDGWNSLLLDGGNENEEINLHKHFLTSENICSIFKKYDVPKEPEYVSIDVDSTDLWIFKKLLGEYRAQVFSVEYNPNFPLDAAITFPDNPDEYWEGDRGYGASLKALTMVAEEAGYSLLWVVPNVDAFFIRTDLIDDGTGNLVFPFEKWKDATSMACHYPLKDKRKAEIFLDYEVYLASNGDVDKSKEKALPVCRKCLNASLSESFILKMKRFVPAPLRGVAKRYFSIFN